MQTMDKFAGNSRRIIFSISAKGLLRCSLDWCTIGKRGVCVYRYKDGKVDDAREFVAALASVIIPKSLISYMYRMVDQLFGPSAKSTTEMGWYPKAFGAGIIGTMSDISDSFDVMLNKRRPKICINGPPAQQWQKSAHEFIG
jgi:hypothetical protein